MASVSYTDIDKPVQLVQIVNPGTGGTSGGSNAALPPVDNGVPITIMGATTISRLLSSAATTNPTSVKTAAGRLYTLTGYNTNAAARYMKFYNKASAPTVGTDTPLWTEYLAPQAKFTLQYYGVRFPTGIAYAVTTSAADNDTTALLAGDIVCMNIAYS